MFKVGDIVECINDGGYEYLEYGRQYEVTRVWNEYGNDFVDVRKIGDRREKGGYYLTRFKLANRKQSNNNLY
jgi:hypothetical protein